MWRTEERNPRSLGLDEKSIPEILRIMNEEDKKVADAVERVLPAIEQAVQAFIEAYQRGGRIFYVGSGTSGRIGVLDAAELPPTFGVPPERVQGVLAGGLEAFFRADERLEDNREAGRRVVHEKRMDRRDLVIGLTASGETPFVLGCVEEAKRRKITTVGITNNPEGTLVKLVDIAIVPLVGPEVIAGSTRLKAGTSQKMVLNMISTAAMVKLGKVYDNLMIDLQAKNAKLKRRAEAILKALTTADAERIRRTLAEANYEVKPALLMLKAGLAYPEAKRLLEEHQGRVREALQKLRTAKKPSNGGESEAGG
jgi:N-acetylmuramic acid 6-phosphate etherase